MYRLREFVEVPKVQIFALYEKKALSERSEFDFFSYALSKGMYLWYFWILEPDTESGYFMACKDSSLNTISSSAPTF